MRDIVRRGWSIALICFCSSLVLASKAHATTITFSEPGAPAGPLDMSTFYNSYGVTFQNSVLFGPDPRLPGDGFGITNTTASGTVNFITPVSSIDLVWVTAGGGVSFFADAFDASNNLVDSFFFDGSGATASQNGTATLGGNSISRLVYHDGDSQVAIDTLTYGSATVPEPGTILLLGGGLLGLARATRRKTKA
jgi:hypothetical protein